MKTQASFHVCLWCEFLLVVWFEKPQAGILILLGFQVVSELAEEKATPQWKNSPSTEASRISTGKIPKRLAVSQ